MAGLTSRRLLASSLLFFAGDRQKSTLKADLAINVAIKKGENKNDMRTPLGIDIRTKKVEEE